MPANTMLAWLRRGPWARNPVWRNTAGALLAGLLMFASFPPRPLWFLAPAGIAILALVLRSARSNRAAFGYGLLGGLGFFTPLLPWVGIFVGPLPWLALSLASAVYVGLFGLIARYVAQLPGWPIWVAAAWSLAEWGKASFPFGGFPWGRLAFGQASGPLLPLASFGGAPLLSFAVALTGTAAAAALSASLQRDWRRLTAAAGLLAVLVAASTAGWLSLPSAGSGERTTTVAVIQGNVPRLGLDFNAQRRAVLDYHVRRTIQLATDVTAGRERQPDVVIWPENSSDIDPLRNSDAAAEITRAATAIRAPILVGAVLINGDSTTTNSVIVWGSGDREAAGPGERHDKRIIQPFGEYLPLRSFFRLFSAHADRAGYFVPGHGNGTVHAGGITIGVATCYEVAFDNAFQTSLGARAQLLTVPTNNATFGRSDMTYQQLAMSRVRAVEHGRALAVAATTGVSAMITARGGIISETGQFTPAALVAQLPVRTGTTLATRLGPLPEYLLCLAAGLALAAGVTRRRAPAVFQRPAAGPDTNTDASASTGGSPAMGENSQPDNTGPTTDVTGISAHTLVIIPTYNERENLPQIITRLHTALPKAHVLVVDDGSPDGTGEVASELAAADDAKRIQVMHRTEKNGLGAAYIAGFHWALERDYKVLVEMDADGSHAPEQLHLLLAASQEHNADLVIGSRYVPGGGTVNWPWIRQLISRGGNFYVRLALGVRYRDITAGYRAYKREILEALDLDAVESRGYGFQVDMTWRLIQRGASIVEVPITFTEREIGESKMSGSIVREAFLKVGAWGITSRWHKLRRLFGAR